MLSLALFQRIWRRKILIWTCNAAPFADPSRCFCYRLCSCCANSWRTSTMSTEPTPIKRPLSSTLSGLYTVFEHLCTLPDEEWNTKRSTFNWDWRSAASHSETSPKSLFKGARRMVINEISLSWMLCLFNMKKITTARSYENRLLTLSRPFKQNYRLPLPSHTFTYETCIGFESRVNYRLPYLK